MTVCAYPDCGRTVFAKGWCNSHYLQARDRGAPYRPIGPRGFAALYRDGTAAGCADGWTDRPSDRHGTYVVERHGTGGWAEGWPRDGATEEGEASSGRVAVNGNLLTECERAR